MRTIKWSCWLASQSLCPCQDSGREALYVHVLPKPLNWAGAPKHGVKYWSCCRHKCQEGGNVRSRRVCFPCRDTVFNTEPGKTSAGLVPAVGPPSKYEGGRGGCHGSAGIFVGKYCIAIANYVEALFKSFMLFGFIFIRRATTDQAHKDVR